MRIALIAVGQRMPAWIREGFDDYAKRLRTRLPITLVEIAPGKRSSGDVSRAMAEEAKRQLTGVREDDYVVVLDERGKSRTTQELSRWLAKRLEQGQNLAFLVGGPDGIAAPVQARANERWSLSPLTLPHALVRVVWIEQIYRAVTLLDGHPYHRE
jgi:23S rRNA (pseudouridine1915-N3)-methyltransferase